MCNVMDSKTEKPHFVLIPLLAPGHMIPMIDIARLLSEQGAVVSLVTTLFNAARSPVDPAIRVLEFPFPCEWAGLPPGCENLDSIPSKDLIRNFYAAMDQLQAPLERLLEASSPRLSCVISDKCLSWTSKTARKFNVPRIVFHGTCCFSLLAAHNIRLHRAHLTSADSFIVPGMPVSVEIAKAQLPGSFVTLPDLDDIRDQMHEAEVSSFGVVVNTFRGLEPECIRSYEAALGKPVWCIGPVSLSNRNAAHRGNKNPSLDHATCLRWLDSHPQSSVIYACLGSQCRLVPDQLIELALGLEASNRPFIWVVKTGSTGLTVLEKWASETGFEERVKGRGLVIWRWAAQALILSHRSVGGFVTHCGWNSVIEAVSRGVPMATWPQFAEQFLNERLVVDVLRVGVAVGVKTPVRLGDEERLGVLVTRDDVAAAVEAVMAAEDARRRAVKLAEMAREAVAGSSSFDVVRMVQDVVSCVQSR